MSSLLKLFYIKTKSSEYSLLFCFNKIGYIAYNEYAK